MLSWIKAIFIWLFVSLWLATVRIRVLYSERRLYSKAHGRALIYAFWHGRQMALFKFNPEAHLTVMVSKSKDGEMQTKICRLFGVKTVRGSSSRSGMAGLLALARNMAEGSAVAMAVDGPKGPVYKAKPGAMMLARTTGLPVVPVTVSCSRYWRLSKAWDEFMIPKPFCRATVALGEPLKISRDASGQEVQRMTNELTCALRRLTEKVDAVGRG
jgi:lysophospholipid acyltransferase (LPLAT)-like uncharacterized protein